MSNDTTRYYAVTNEGKTVAESANRFKLELMLRDMYSDEEIKEMEIEIIEGK